MSSPVVLSRVSALVPLSVLLVGCAEPPPPAAPASKPPAAVVVDEVVETVAPESAGREISPQPAALVVEETVESVAPATSSERVDRLLAALTAPTADAKARIEAIDDLAELRAEATASVASLVAALADADAGVRWHAARAVGLLGRDAVSALPALVGLLSDADPVVVTQSAAAIGMIRSDDDRDEIPEADAKAYAATVEPLVATLVHPDPRARRAAVRAIRRVSTSREELAKTVRKQLADADPIAVMPALHTLADMGADAVPFLLESLDDPASRYWSEVVLAEIGPAAAPAVGRLTQLAGEGEIAERMQAILALAEIGPPAAPAVATVVEALESPDASLRYVAAFALGKLGSHEADEALTTAASSDDPFLAALASWARAALHPDDNELVGAAAAKLRAGLTDESPAVRNAAVEGLSDLAPRLSAADRQALAAALVELLDDPVPAVGLAAGGGLIRLKGDAVASLQAGLDHQPMRNDALEILAEIGPAAAPALDDMIEYLEDADPVSRSDAAFAIAAIGPDAKTAVPALEKLLGDESADASVRYTVAYALGKIGPAAAAAEPLLRSLVESDDDLMATVCAWAALQIKPGDKDLFAAAVPKLRRALQQERELVRLEAAIALGEIGPPAASALPMLELLAEDDPSGQVRAAAEAAVGLIRK